MSHPLPAPPPTQQPTAFQSAGFSTLCLFLFLAFGRLGDFLFPTLHIPLVTSLFCLVMVLLSGSVHTVFFSRIAQSLALFSVWLLACIPSSYWRGGSVELFFDVWAKSFAAFVITGALVLTLRHIVRAIHVLAYAFLTAALLSVFYGQQTGGRFRLDRGLYAGINEYAAAMVQGVVFWWFLTYNPARPLSKRVLSSLALIPLIYVLFRTGSRAALITLFAVLVLVFFRYSVRGRIIMTIAAAAALTAGLLMLPPITRMRFLTFFEISNVEGELSEQDVNTLIAARESSRQRAHLLARSLQLTAKHPVFGVGPGNFAVAENDMAVNEGKPRGAWLGTHNTYTQVSSEMGIPGLVFFLAAMFFCWRDLRQAVRTMKKLPNTAEWLAAASTLQLALSCYAIFFFFEHIAYDMFFPVLAGLILGFARAAEAYRVAATPPRRSSGAPSALAGAPRPAFAPPQG